MRKTYLITGLLVLVAAPYSYAQQSLLPERFGSWEPGSRPPFVMWPRNPRVASLDSRPEYTELLIESGMVRVEEGGYQNHGSELELRLFQLRDPSSAYEVYTSRISSEMHPSTVWEPSATGNGHLILLIGNVVAEIAGPENASTADLRQLANTIKAHSDPTPLPPIRAYLPTGFVDGTQRYARGPAGFRNAVASLKQDEFANLVDQAGFNLSAEAMFAQYRAGKEQAVLLLLEYPTPQLAEQHLASGAGAFDLGEASRSDHRTQGLPTFAGAEALLSGLWKFPAKRGEL